MLTHLCLHNFAIISELTLDCRSGMTVVTGETGAGKSIMIDALELGMGARADTTVIKHGAEKCDISATFDLTRNEKASAWLQEHDLATDQECILRRTISIEGRSRNYINGHPVPLHHIRELSQYLVNIHGQHENQALLDRDHQREILDRYARHEPLVKQVKHTHQELKLIEQQLSQLITQTGDSARQEFLRFQVAELNEFALTENELNALEQEHKVLSNAGQLIQDGQIILDRLSESDETILQQLSMIESAALRHHEISEPFKNVLRLVQEATINLTEANQELRHYLDAAELNPERLLAVESRLTKLYELARKHHVSPDQLFAKHQQILEELHNLEGCDEKIENLKKQITNLTLHYRNACEKLTASRQKAAKQLAKAVSQHIKTLSMPDGEFAVELSPHSEASPYGAEKILFTVSANAGIPQQALHKVASGGELSRISLAIQVITASQEAASTLLFDEVDVGVGGATAEIVGQLLRQLAVSSQVICVTHLPQVAALGEHHLKVSKLPHPNVEFLKPEARVQEIARMLGGLKVTKQTLAHAEEMLKTVEA